MHYLVEQVFASTVISKPLNAESKETCLTHEEQF
jgi:hypothetical protein